MFSSLTQRFEGIFSRLRSRGRLTEKDVRETAREVRRALLEADVHFRVARDFVRRIEERLVGADVLGSLTPAQHVIKAVHAELTELLGGRAEPLTLSGAEAAVMVVGLQGSGKTTFCAKLAAHLRERGRRPVLVALDVYRPAAADQLEVLGRSIDVPVARGEAGETDVVAILERARRTAREHMADTLVLDTAGRLHVDDAMMGELERLAAAAHPEHTLLVLDAMTGQEAVHVAEAFHERLELSGVVLTKLDGDARGGAALSVRYITGRPIKFIGTGEKPDGLDVFHPDRAAGRILDMGDVLSLIEKTEAAMDAERAARLERRVRDETFDLTDFVEQLRQIRRLGPIDELLKLIPGGAKLAARGVDVDPKQLDRVEAIINSMTPEERARPQIIDGSRRKRIARGSGTSVQAVNQLLKQFRQMKKMMKNMTKLQKMHKRVRMPFPLG